MTSDDRTKNTPLIVALHFCVGERSFALLLSFFLSFFLLLLLLPPPVLVFLKVVVVVVRTDGERETERQKERED